MWQCRSGLTNLYNFNILKSSKMFKILKNFVIYLLLLPHTFPQPIGTNDSSKETILDVEKAMQKEIAPVLENFENFVNIVDKDTRLLKKGEFLGELMSLGRKAVKTDQLLHQLLHQLWEKENVIRKALKTFVVPYLCRNFELYEQVWDNGGTNSKDFNSDDNENAFLKQHDLSIQTMKNYKHHAKVWDRILTSSKHPLVKIFKDKIELLYPKLTLPMIAKNLGLAHALLNNAKHDAVNDEPEIVQLLNPDSLIGALKEWKSMRDPVLLNIIKAFEQVVSGS